MELTTAIDSDWGTPFDLFDLAQFCFGDFDLDASAEADWKMCKKYIDLEQDALNPNTPWDGNNVWINPRYDIKSITAFVKRALVERHKRCITFLVPVKADQQWYHDLLENGATFLFIRGRVKFRRRNGLPAIGAGFPCMLVNLTPENVNKTRILLYEKQVALLKTLMAAKFEFLRETIAEEIDREVLGELIAKWEQQKMEGTFHW